MIIATAGHVDHGKTSLVRALTGVDTDRLPEEKRRGMTIDLGFAYTGSLGFVDVPGHERFVHNMLAGVAGIDLALLVVAADDGPMPQTREHLAILELLGVPRVVVALTKIDRVSSERVLEVRSQMQARLPGAPVFPVSSVTGDGLASLKDFLENSRTEKPRLGGNFRLSVDRCFTIAGAGLVVTGTAVSGEIAVGAEVRVLLAGTSARVRAIHAHNAPADRGEAGQRLALNLSGLKIPVRRGDWVTAGAVPEPVQRFDARLYCLHPVKHWMPVHVHLGAADVLGRIALLDDAGLVQLVLEQPVAAVRGDGFIVRDQSAQRTLGGGRVIDVFPPVRGRAKPERLAWLAAMEIEDHDAALAALLELAPEGVDLARFAANRNLPAAAGRRFAPRHWSALRERALGTLAAWHARMPDAVGMPEDQVLPKHPEVVDALLREGAVVRQGASLRLASHEARIHPDDAALWKKLEPLLAGLRPPSLAELSGKTGVDAKKLEASLSRAVRHGLVARVSKTRFFQPAALARLEEMFRLEAQAGPVTAAAFRDRTGIGRNVAIEVLEYFDRIKFSRRVGDAHVLVGNRGQSPISNEGRDTHPGGAHGLQIR